MRLLYLLLPLSLLAADWPTASHDNQRSGVTPEQLRPPLALAWTFQAAPPAPGWAPPAIGYGAYKNKSNVDFDDAYRVTAAGKFVYFAASGENQVYALRAGTGEVAWRFFTGAAPRLAPSIWDGRAYVGADDGKVSCLDATTGAGIWQFDAAPSGRQILGHGRFASHRPVRAGVLIEDGIAYFAAGLFPSEGIYLFALDAKTGKLRWRRPLDGAGNEAHSPQGYPLADADSIFLPSRVQPSRWSKKAGIELPFATPIPRVKDDAYRYHNGGSYAQLWNSHLVYGQAAILGFDPNAEYEDKYGRNRLGQRLFHYFNARRIVFRDTQAWITTDDYLICVDSAKLPSLAETLVPRFEAAYKKHRVAAARAGLESNSQDSHFKYILREYEKWPAAREPLIAEFAREAHWLTREIAPESLILAGDTLYAGGETELLAINANTGAVLWRSATDSRVRGLAVANSRLYASTVDGRIRCFAKSANPALPALEQAAVSATKGFALIVGGDAESATALAETSSYRITQLLRTPQPARTAIAAAGLYGRRITVSQLGDTLPYAPYLFNHVQAAPDLLPEAELLRVTRPYGGTLRIGDREQTRGPLAGAKNWTHNYGSPANRQCSDDKLVRGPFSILWYGEPGPRQRIDRHATPPMPLVVNGRMFLEGYDLLMAYDIYNGVKHWERSIPGVTRRKLPVGTSNLAADHQHLYAIVNNRECWQLDAETGDTIGVIPVPELTDHKTHYWGWLAKVGDTLFGSRADPDTRRRRAKVDTNHAIFAIDSRSGTQKWLRQGQGIDNDAIAIADGRLFYVDRAVPEDAVPLRIRDESVPERKTNLSRDTRKLVALDANSGDELWSQAIDLTDLTLDDRVIGSHIGFGVLCMVSQGVVVLSGQGSLGHPYREYKRGEFSRRAIYAFDAASGKLLWGGRKNYRKRPVIVGDTIYAEPFAWDLRSGKRRNSINPLTGASTPVDFLRAYSGCDHLVASGAALFGNAGSGGMAHLNLGDHSGYSPFGNLMLSCGTGAVPAGGVFVAPEGRSGCTCSTPIHSSLVLYPSDRSETWAFSAGGAEQLDCLPVQHVAINLGAPGFRTDASGQLWLPYSGERLTGRFRDWLPKYQHSSEMFFAESADLLPIVNSATPWVYTSAYIHSKELRFPLLDPKRHEPARYTLRLHFAEPEDLSPGDRRFDIIVQGKPVATAFDIVAAAGGSRRAHIVEFASIAVTDMLRISFKPLGLHPPLLCGFQLHRE
jgi:outer membrane protein assembly factor BamB